MSIVIPTLDRNTLIEQALASIAAQEWNAVEVIVIDDGSQDDTAARIEALVSGGFCWPVTYRWQRNAGPGAARNHGLRLARGEYVYFLDSDDVMESRALSYLIGVLQTTGAAYAVGLVANTDLAGVPDGGEPLRRPCVVLGDIIGSSWYTHAALYRADLIEAVGGYDTSRKFIEDAEFHWRILATAGPPAFCQHLIAARRLHDLGQLSEDKGHIAEARRFLALLEHMQTIRPATLCTGPNALRVFLLGIEFGADAEWDGHARSRALLQQMAAERLALSAIFILALTHRSPAYYRGLRSLMARTRPLAKRWFKRRILWHSKDTDR